jgi:hypothetical protein
VPKDSFTEEFLYNQMLDARNITDQKVRLCMVKLREMGLKDFDKNLATLNQCSMNFELTVEKLLQ